MVVAETSYRHLSTYDDSFRTDNDDSCWGKFSRYKVPGELIVTSVGDASPIEVPNAAVNVLVLFTASAWVVRVPGIGVGSYGTAHG